MNTRFSIAYGWRSRSFVPTLLTIFLAAVRLAAGEKTPASDAIRLTNGDLLFGKLVSIDPASGVRWQHPDAREMIEWSYDAVSEIQLAPATNAPAALAHRCFVHLRNDDELDAGLISCDAERVVLDTSYAGKITLPRSTVLAISPVPPAPATLFAGLTGVEGWTIGKVTAGGTDAGEWKYKNGALYANKAASIARDIKLPDSACLHFDVAWKGNLYIAIALYTDYLQPVNLQNKETEPDFGGFYSLQLNSYYARLLPVKQHEPLRDLGQVSVPKLTQTNFVHVEIRASKSKNMIALLLDGALIKQWIDPERFAGRGTGIRMVHQGQGAVKLDGLRITDWDGHFDEADGSVVSGPEDVARLRNEEKLTGKIESVQAGKIVFVQGGKNSELGLESVARLEFARTKIEPSSGPTGEVRASFAGRGSVTFQLQRWTEQGVEASSPSFGRAIFNPAAFSRIEFKRTRRPTTPEKLF